MENLGKWLNLWIHEMITSLKKKKKKETIVDSIFLRPKANETVLHRTRKILNSPLIVLTGLHISKHYTKLKMLNFQ